MILQYQRPTETVAGKAEKYLCKTRSDVAAAYFSSGNIARKLKKVGNH